MPRLTNAERSTGSRARLLVAAADVFGRAGFQGASMSAIVELAGLTKGAAYFHFESKEALAREVVQAQYDRWPSLVEEVRAGTAEPLDALVDLVLRVGRMFRDDPVVRAGVRLAAERRSIPVDLPRPFVRWNEQVAVFLADARARGQLNEQVDVEATARVIVSSFFGIQFVSDALTDRQDVEDRLREFWALMMPRLRPSERCMTAGRHEPGVDIPIGT